MAYRCLLGAQVRSQAQYRASLAIDVVGSVLFGVLDIVSVLVLFRVTLSWAASASLRSS